MSSTAEVLVRWQVKDVNGQLTNARDVDTPALAITATPNGKLEQVTLSNGFTALSPPTSAVAVIINPVSGSFTFTLKGVTGDTGIVLATSATLGLPIVLPLGTSPSIGLTCTGAAVVEVLWL